MEQVKTVIVGAGFSGLGMGIELLNRGDRDFVILEKSPVIGGTWRDNVYPGCTCDVPSLLYSYSFETDVAWSRPFAPQPEIQQYTLHVAKKYGLEPYIRLDSEAQEIRWDDERAVWQVTTPHTTFEAKFLVAAQGPLHQPRIPAIPGLEDFDGPVFHSAQWDHDVDLTGKRVAVIGSGSSAIQFVPEIQPDVGELVLFQRTAPWVLPRGNEPLSDRAQAALKWAPVRSVLRQAIYGGTELIQIGQRNPAVMDKVADLARWQLERQVDDPQLREALTPNWTLGCKRMLFSKTWYPALTADNARVIPHGLERVEGNTLVGSDGSEAEVDVVILGTGFHVSDASLPMRVFGRGGKSLSDVWDGTPTGYLGTSVHGFPNAFLMLGPNLGNGHGSVFVILEAQTAYIADCMRQVAERGIRTFDVRQAPQVKWNEAVQAGLEGTVWNAGGCDSWYIDGTGTNSAIYPWTTIDMRRRMQRFDLTAYHLEHEENAPSVSVPTEIDLDGAVVAITGGARGIGFETARAFVDRGAFVCIGDLDPDAAHEAARKLGPTAAAWKLDVGDRGSVEAFVDAVERHVGPIDVFVNNAGIMPTGPFLTESDEALQAAMRVNVVGTAFGMKVVLPRMIRRRKGHVVNIASLAGKFQIPWMAGYVASKHAAVGLTGAVRSELEGTGVTLSAVLPTAVDTRLASGVSHRGLFARKPEHVAEAVVRSVRTRSPEITVPRRLRPAAKAYAMLPRRAVRLVMKAFGADRLLDEATRRAREVYEKESADQGVIEGPWRSAG